MATEILEGTIPATEPVRNKRGYVMFDQLKFRDTAGKERLLPKFCASGDVANALKKGGEGRFYLTRWGGQSGIHGVRLKDGTQAYSHYNNLELLLLLGGLAGAAMLVIGLMGVDGFMITPVLIGALLLIALVFARRHRLSAKADYDLTHRAERRALAPITAALLLGACNSEAAPPPSEKVAGEVQAPAFPRARPVVPYVRPAGTDCIWTMHDRSEKWIRGGIGRGDEDPVFDFVDRAFYGWSDSERHSIEISVGDRAKRLVASAWGSGAVGQGSIGFYVGPELRKLIGGATSLQVWKDGKPVFNTALANTPTTAELDACVQPPGWDVDSE